MRVLLDTHALLWFIEGDARLPVVLQTLMNQAVTQKYVSRISFWELSIKASLGKLNTVQSPALMLKQVESTDAVMLDIQSSYLEHLKVLPFHHRDPFDRLLIATAMTEELPLISADRHFQRYEGLKLLWD